jgi:hypothetical protein
MRISDITHKGEYGTVLKQNEDGSFEVKSGLGRIKTIKVINGKVFMKNSAVAWNPKAQPWIPSFKQTKIPQTDFFSTTTNIPEYDSMLDDADYFYYNKDKLAELVYMRPMEYITKCSNGRYNKDICGFGHTVNQEIAGAKKSLVKKYAEDMKKGSKFPVPIIEYDKRGISQEGRHRALAVQLLIDEGYVKKSYTIPVVIIKAV